MTARTNSGIAIAHPNIALIKYWGNLDDRWNIPASGSISMTLGELAVRVHLISDENSERDTLIINGESASEAARERVSQFLDHVRYLSRKKIFCRVESTTNFPRGSGLASSAAAFAALAVAAAHVFGLSSDATALSRLARLGSGSACRSIFGGFVEWVAGVDHLTSYAKPIAPAHYWQLVDCIAIVSSKHKAISSREGHRLASSSPLQPCRIRGATQRLEQCRQAILGRDFEQLAAVVELDSNLMHSVMMTSQPPLFYWRGETVEIMERVRQWRSQGLPVCYTVDAGPNVHVLTPADVATQVVEKLKLLRGVKQVIAAPIGEGAMAIESD
jgi:diphosphomevalonate decarboxylase